MLVSISFKKNYFISNYAYVCVHCAQVPEELQAGVSHLPCVLGIKVGCSARAVLALKCRASSPDAKCHFLS